jgi:hypothetical protein
VCPRIRSGIVPASAGSIASRGTRGRGPLRKTRGLGPTPLAGVSYAVVKLRASGGAASFGLSTPSSSSGSGNPTLGNLAWLLRLRAFQRSTRRVDAAPSVLADEAPVATPSTKAPGASRRAETLRPGRLDRQKSGSGATSAGAGAPTRSVAARASRASSWRPLWVQASVIAQSDHSGRRDRLGASSERLCSQQVSRRFGGDGVSLLLVETNGVGDGTRSFDESLGEAEHRR